jgi:hypothetical protein
MRGIACLFAIVSFASPLGLASCSHETQEASSPLGVRPTEQTLVETSTRADREVTTVAVLPPGKTEGVASPPSSIVLPALDTPAVQRTATIAGVLPVAAVDAKSSSVAGDIARARLNPEVGELIEGHAMALEDSVGVRMVVHVRLGVRGRYEAYLLDASRRCDEYGRAPVASRKGVELDRALGVLNVGDSGSGSLAITIPIEHLQGGLRSLDRRAVAIFDGVGKPIAGKRAVACGTMTVVRTSGPEPVG